MTEQRKICVVTGSRADYGLLRPLLTAIRTETHLKLQLMVTGMHLSSEFGNTWRAIVDDGFDIDERVEMLLASDSEHAISSAMALGLVGFSNAVQRLRPDIIALLGDRFEIMAAAMAAMLHRIPIAHIHGGEVSEGAFDEAIRHSITKMSQLHFTATDAYRKRVIQLGENPRLVHNVGALAADNIAALPLLNKKVVEREIDMPLDGLVLLVTYHPVTLSEEDTVTGVEALLKALDYFPEARVVLTRANADVGGSLVNLRFEKYATDRAARCVVFNALGTVRYLSVMRLATAVVGNSSSGLIEAPIMGVPTVNIGDRQRGRLRVESIIDCNEDATNIAQAIKQAQSKDFRSRIAGMQSPYGDGKTAPRICRYLSRLNLEGLVKKHFHDIDFDF